MRPRAGPRPPAMPARRSCTTSPKTCRPARAEFAPRLRDLTGRPGEAEVEAAIRRLFTYAAWADKYDGQAKSVPIRGVALAMNEPCGVIGALCPDEAPLLGLISVMAPAIAMGNTCVLVPSEPFPLAATDFYQVLDTSDAAGGRGQHRHRPPCRTGQDRWPGTWMSMRSGAFPRTDLSALIETRSGGQPETHLGQPWPRARLARARGRRPRVPAPGDRGQDDLDALRRMSAGHARAAGRSGPRRVGPPTGRSGSIPIWRSAPRHLPPSSAREHQIGRRLGRQPVVAARSRPPAGPAPSRHSPAPAAPTSGPRPWPAPPAHPRSPSSRSRPAPPSSPLPTDSRPNAERSRARVPPGRRDARGCRAPRRPRDVQLIQQARKTQVGRQAC